MYILSTKLNITELNGAEMERKKFDTKLEIFQPVSNLAIKQMFFFRFSQ